VDWVQVGIVTGLPANSRRSKWFFSSRASRPVLGLTRPRIPCVPDDSFPGNKATGAWSWTFTCSQCRGYEWMELYLCFPVHAVMTWTGSSLPYTRAGHGSRAGPVTPLSPFGFPKRRGIACLAQRLIACQGRRYLARGLWQWFIDYTTLWWTLPIGAGCTDFRKI